MIFRYVTPFFRHLKKHWVIALLNIFSYGLGIAACIVIVQNISYETSYDKFYDKYEMIYRVQLDHFYNNTFQNSTAVSFYPVGPELKKNYPEILDFARVRKITSAIVAAGENSFLEDRVYFADSTLFNLFSIPMIKGSVEKVGANSVFLSESMAKKYFGTDNPIGNTIRIDFQILPVIGVFRDIPNNSHWKCDIINIVGHEQYMTDNWKNYGYHTYVKLRGDSESFKDKLKSFSQEFSQIANLQSGVVYGFDAKLQPLADIHLQSDLQNEHESNARLQDIYILLGVAVMILIISCFNYVNMTNAINATRSRETFIRRIHGASNKNALTQHMIESLVLNIVGFGIALFILGVFIQWVGPMFNFYDVRIDWADAVYYYTLVAIFIIAFLFSGVFPSIMAASTDLSHFLSRSSTTTGMNGNLTKSMAIAQFVFSYILISGGLVVTKQLTFVSERSLGFDYEDVVAITLNPIPYTNFENGFNKLRDDLERQSSIHQTTFSFGIPGERYDQDASFRFTSEASETAKFCFIQMVAENYFATYQIEFIEGRSFSNEMASDLNAVVVNQALARKLNIKDDKNIIGKQITVPVNNEYRDLRVIGVVKDYHHESLAHGIDPVIYYPIRSNGFCSKISVRMSKGREASRSEDVELIQETFRRNFSSIYSQFDLPTTYNIKDVKAGYKEQYKNDEQFSKLVNTLAFLAIIMAGIGFFGLASSTTGKRTKEIAIRKINGAKTSQVSGLLLSYFLKLIGIAIVISLPISYLVAVRWLNEFPFRTEIGLWFVLWPIVVTAILSVLSVTYHVVKVVIVNPVSILRNE